MVVGKDAFIFQSTHPVWDGTSRRYLHAVVPVISIHPSRVGWDAGVYGDFYVGIGFQSTHPVWDGTFLLRRQLLRCCHFNPPIPCGMGQNQRQRGSVGRNISIHPSRVGWDLSWTTLRSLSQYFNPPIPCGMGQEEADGVVLSDNFNPPIPCGMGPRQRKRISTTAVHFNPPIPCGMGLSALYSASLSRFDFNPPIPCGMGPDSEVITIVGGVFQSTHPVWDGTWGDKKVADLSSISIHPSRVGWDPHGIDIISSAI